MLQVLYHYMFVYCELLKLYSLCERCLPLWGFYYFSGRVMENETFMFDLYISVKGSVKIWHHCLQK